MNSDPKLTQKDQALRAAIRRADDLDTQALQQRVLTQWRQRHPAPAGVAAMPLRAGPAAMLGLARRQRQIAAIVVLGLMLALAGWYLRPDPVLTELLQPDVLSELGLGEL